MKYLLDAYYASLIISYWLLLWFVYGDFKSVMKANIINNRIKAGKDLRIKWWWGSELVYGGIMFTIMAIPIINLAMTFFIVKYLNKNKG